MVPKQKLSRSRTRQRRSHHAKVGANYSGCPKCQSPRLPHTACDNCGYVRPGLSLALKKKED